MLFKKKNSLTTKSARSINLVPTSDYKNILVIIDKAEQIRHNQLNKLFPSASFTFLSARTEKEDNSSGKNYTFHRSDKRLTNIKNERLQNLLVTKFDLLIDLSSDRNLKHFCEKINANLKAGCFNTISNYHLDLLVKFNDSIEEIVEDIARQIKSLT